MTGDAGREQNAAGDEQHAARDSVRYVGVFEVRCIFVDGAVFYAAVVAVDITRRLARFLEARVTFVLSRFQEQCARSYASDES